MAVVGVLVALALLRDRELPAWLALHAGALVAYAAVPVTLLLLAALTCRVVVTRRALSRRVRLVVLAPDSFAPTLDGVLRCAAQLSRVRRLVGGWLDPRASAVRVLLDNSEGAMRYSLVVPERALPAIRSALSNYDRVQVRRADPEPPLREDECVMRAELRFAQPSSEPLAHLSLDPDPLQSFARVLAGLDPSRERAQVAVDLLPCTAGARRRLRRRLLRQARRDNPTVRYNSGGVLDVLAGGGRQVGRQPAAMLWSSERSASRSRRSCCRPSRCFGCRSWSAASPGEGRSPTLARSARLLRRLRRSQLLPGRWRPLAGPRVPRIGPSRPARVV